jgi:hypothetical protein
MDVVVVTARVAVMGTVSVEVMGMDRVAAIVHRHARVDPRVLRTTTARTAANRSKGARRFASYSLRRGVVCARFWSTTTVSEIR